MISPKMFDVVLPAGITVIVMIATKFTDGFFSRWQARRADRLASENERSRQRREDRLRSEKERDEWREKYYQEKEDHLKTIATCQDHEKRLADAVQLLDRRKTDPVVEHLNNTERRRKTDR